MTRIKSVIFLFLFLFCINTQVYGTENEISIIEVGNKVKFIVNGNVISLNLRSHEEVIWNNTHGNTAAVVTDIRIVCISSGFGTLEEIKLKIDEKKTDNPMPVVYKLFALFTTNKRAIGFNSVTNKFLVSDMAVDEKPVAIACSEKTATIATEKTGYAFSEKSDSFSKISLRIDEKISSAGVGFIKTTKRLVSFDPEALKWSWENV